MGKISDALDKHNKERAVRTENLHADAVDALRIEDPEMTRVRKAMGNWSYDPKLVVVSAPESIDAENFRSLRAQILMRGNGGSPCRTLLVTSAFPGEGKTFVAANLAVSLALGIDEHVLLVDCDLRMPHLHEMMGYTRQKGLADLLAGKQAISDLLTKTRIEKLTMIQAGTPPRNPAELLSSNRMESFIDEVRSRYDDRYIVLDGTPTQFASETAVLSRHVDGVILVVRAGKAPRRGIHQGLQNLDRKKILGVVFNNYNASQSQYHKYYSNYYQK